MKTKWLLMMLMVVGLMAGAAQANMLTNPGFEDGAFSTDPKTYPSDWSLVSGSWTTAYTWKSDTGAHSGTKYMLIQPWYNSPDYDAHIYQPVTGVIAGEDYEFSVWSKNAVEDAKNEQRFYLQWYNTSSLITSGAPGFMSSYGVYIDVTSTEWTQFDFGTFTAPGGAIAASFWIGVYGYNPSATHFDDAGMFDTLHVRYPSPADGATVSTGAVVLSWKNADPNYSGHSVYVDVWFGPDPNEMSKEVTAGENQTSVPVSAPDVGTYYWQVDSYRYGSPIGDPCEGPLWSFNTVSDLPPSSVDAGVDMITWSGKPVVWADSTVLDAVVVDDGQSALSYAWSAVPADGVSFDPNEFIEDPTVTIDKSGNLTTLVLDPGFEDTLLDDGEYEYVDTQYWTGGYYTGTGTWWDNYVGYWGVWNPSGDLAPEGINVAMNYGDPGYDMGISQQLSINLQPSTLYELSVQVGNLTDATTADYRVELLAGGSLIASTGGKTSGYGDPSPVPGEWLTASLSHNSGAAGTDPNVGQPLEIRLINVDSDLENYFDDVKLTATPAYPFPAVHTVTLTLAVNDEGNPDVFKTNSMTIDVYDDACAAARLGAGRAADNPADFDENCITDIKDLAALLTKWLVDNALTEPKAIAAVANADLIAYWPFDEGTGDIAYDAIGDNDGQITGGTWVMPGKIGDAALEGAGDDEVNCGPGPTPTTEDLTLAWWMIDNHSSYGTIMDKSVTDSGYGYNILVRPPGDGGPLRFRIGGWQSYGGWGEECRIPDGAYNDGEWVHITCTYDSATDTATIYVNGELVENGDYNPKTGIAGPGGYCDGVNNPDTPLYIRGGEETFNGVLDEVAIWDTALTPDQVRRVYESGVGSLGGPSPADGATVPVGNVELSWTNMDPNPPATSVYVDVWFGTEPNVTDPGYDMIKVVTAGENTTTVQVSAPDPNTYYWRVDSYIYGPGHINEPNAIEGAMWSFNAAYDAPPSVDDAGIDMITWSGQAVQLDPNVVDEGASELTWLWSANPDAGVVFDPNAYIEAPTVTITKVTDNPSVVTLTLSAHDGVGSDEDTMKIDVYDTACLAAQAVDPAAIDQSDFDENCITELKDYAIVAAKWLIDYKLTEATIKP